MSFGSFLALILCAFGLWQHHFEDGLLNDIEALLIMIMALLVSSTEKIIDAIKKKESNVIIGDIKEIKIEKKEVK